MTYGAVIVETRDLPDMGEIITRHIKYLPSDWKVLHRKAGLQINNLSDYNRLLTSVDFWKSVPFDKVLIFQHDSGLLREGIEEFLEYDYVGAPWTFQTKGGNGGLSLRTRDVMIKTLETIPYMENVHGNEDVYFSNHIERVGGKLAPRDVCFKFSCETIFRTGTLGYHAIEKYMKPSQVQYILNQYQPA